ncbi:MAG TPA: DUF433 domain-containing protein [Dehalococcoidia bacterium]|nr:DUF433 domain-containing protein [Dehalococcoidia bacterium]
MSKRSAKPLYPGGPTAEQLLDEVEKQRRVPGIIFADGPTGRRARIAGTGIEVFEIVWSYRANGQNRERLAAEYDWLRPDQLDAALAYAAAFPGEIEHHLKRAEALEQEYAGRNPVEP